jgi:hypothetical protein
MKQVILYIVFFSACIFCACEKNKLNSLSNIDNASINAQMKVNFMSAYQTARPYQIKINDTRVSAGLTYATPFPGGGLNTGGGSTADYLLVSPGQTKVSISLPKFGTNTDSVELASTTVALEAGKNYSLFFADTANKTTVLLTDTLATPDSGYSRYKYLNLIPNLGAIDLYFGTTLVAGNIPFKGTSPFFTVKAGTAAQWTIRAAGSASTSTAITIYPTGTGTYTVPNQRVLTVFTRGYNGITSTTDVRRPLISLLYVR